jgi:hypothetical protein
MSKKRRKSKFGSPVQKPPIPVGGQPDAQEKRDHNESSSPIASDIHPYPNNPDKPEESRKLSIPWRKVLKALEGVGIAAGIFYAIVSFCMWRAMINSNKFARDALPVSQRSYVTLGRKDGIVAEFKRTDDPQFNTGILIYFQNSGHLPAKFNWGWQLWATIPPTNPEVKPPHLFTPMTRTRNRKTGGTGEIGGGSVIGGESVFVSDAGELPQSLSNQLAHNTQLFMMKGLYEYCDELGTYSCKEFMLYYQRIPYDTFRLADERDCVPWMTKPQNIEPDTDYLSACKTFAERENEQTQK